MLVTVKMSDWRRSRRISLHAPWVRDGQVVESRRRLKFEVLSDLGRERRANEVGESERLKAEFDLANCSGQRGTLVGARERPEHDESVAQRGEELNIPVERVNQFDQEFINCHHSR